ncbi:biopolymer transporter ExbD, partial [Escherichia sp. TWPC-MK]
MAQDAIEKPIKINIVPLLDVLLVLLLIFMATAPII